MQLPAIDFPSTLPRGYTELDDGIIYDSSRHLDLHFPDQVWNLEDFGYSEHDISMAASRVAVTSPFRLLSEEGVEALYQVSSQLKSVSTRIEGDRTPQHLAGGVYRSRFLRDLCSCPQVLGHMSSISGTDLLPHSMPSQQVYINYAPDDVSKAVDAWHYDGIGFDYVIMVSDPAKLKGGNFEYFQGTRNEVAEMYGLKVPEVRYGIKEDLPQDRVIKAQFPKAGYAIFQQGNLVVHRAAKLLEAGDRITVVPGLVSRNHRVPDPTAKNDLPGYGEPGISAELARHGAWLAQAKLNDLMQNLDLVTEEKQVNQMLEEAILDVTDTIRFIKTSL